MNKTNRFIHDKYYQKVFPDNVWFKLFVVHTPHGDFHHLGSEIPRGGDPRDFTLQIVKVPVGGMDDEKFEQHIKNEMIQIFQFVRK